MKARGEAPSVHSMAGVSIGITKWLFCDPLQQEMDACLTLTFSDNLSKRIRSAAIHHI